MGFWYEWLHTAIQGANDPAAWSTCVLATACALTILAVVRCIFK